MQEEYWAENINCRALKKLGIDYATVDVNCFFLFFFIDNALVVVIVILQEEYWALDREHEESIDYCWAFYFLTVEH